jgi:branched-chain amino acid aminotransferase
MSFMASTPAPPVLAATAGSTVRSTGSPTDATDATDVSDVTVWANGRIVDPAQPIVSALDHGLVVGDGVFEACKIVDAKAFALSRHLRRLARSAAGLGLGQPDESLIRSAVDAVLAARPLPFGKLRITWTDGVGPLGSGRTEGSRPTLVVASEPATPAPAESTIHTVPWTRNEHGALAGLKTTSYADNVLALARAHENGASEAIFANTAGNVCEGTGSNIVLAIGGRLVTPPLSSGCLAGITRELLLEWTDIEEADVTLDEARTASEVFVTSSMRDIQPVAHWDGLDLPGAAGPVAAQLTRLWAARANERMDP